MIPIKWCAMVTVDHDGHGDFDMRNSENVPYAEVAGILRKIANEFDEMGK